MGTEVSLHYYDKILLAIGLSLSSGALLGVFSDLRLRVGLLAGALLATTFVYHAMFQNPPRPAATPRGKAAAIVWHLFLLSLIGSTLL